MVMRRAHRLHPIARRDRPWIPLRRGPAALGLVCLFALLSRSLPAQQNPAPETKSMNPRRIVLCLDGTWNSTYDENKRDDGTKVLKPTNVLKLCRAVLPVGPVSQREQLAYYEIGVGSLAEYPGTSNHLLHSVDKFLGGVWGAGFEANIEGALNFLVLNHQVGDSVFVFGFSRGAATARGLTHFLSWAGGLPTKGDAYYLPQLFRAYVVAQGKGSGKDVVDQINLKRSQEPRPGLPLAPFEPVNVEFLGVWDTVMALGSRFRSTETSTSPVSKSFYLSAQPASCVRNARQALGIDEERYDFRPEIWQGAAAGQTLEQRWFPGVHSNVGGGYVHDGLANDAFQWILHEAGAKGLEVDPRYVAFYRGYSQDELYNSSSIFYRAFDWARSGKGKRSLVRQPPAANLSLDPSVIRRIHSDPDERDENGKRRFPRLKLYRPESVLLYLACQPDLDQYLAGLGLSPQLRQLPPDVLGWIEKLRPQCAKER
jgi:uncharacterized protein (DUF2235 family)